MRSTRGRRSARRAALLAIGALSACKGAPPRLVSPADGARLGGDVLAIGIEPPGDVEVVFDGHATALRSIPLTAVSDGAHTLALRDPPDGPLRDARTIEIDRTPPVITIAQPGATVPSGGASTLQVVVRVRDASPVTAVTADGTPLNIDPSRAGVWAGEVKRPAGALTIEATDAVGNRATAQREMREGLLRWAVAIPAEPGLLVAHRDAPEDAVLVVHGEGARLIGADGHDRWNLDLAGQVPVDSAFLADGGAVLRVLSGGSPPRSTLVHVAPDGTRSEWSRDGWALALAATGDKPLVAFRTADGSAEGGYAPLPWPPARFVPAALPLEPRRLLALAEGFVADGDSEMVAVDAAGHALWRATHGASAGLAATSEAVFVADATGLRVLDPATGAVRGTVDGPCTGLAAPPGAPARARCRGAFVSVDASGKPADEAGGGTPHAARMPATATCTDDGRLCFADDTIWPLRPAASPIQAPGEVVGAVRVGGSVLAIVAADRARGRSALAVVRGPAPAEIPLDMILGVQRVLPLDDGLLVFGLSAVRPDHGVLLRLAL